MATDDNKHHEQPSPEVMDRILGTLYGGCIGDAIGILSEFLTKEEAKEHYGPVAKKLEYSHKSLVDDDHRIRWEEGDWTDDSDQMVLIMRSLVDCDGKVDLSDFAGKLTNWVKYGYKELKDWCGLGIGTLTAKVTAYPDYLKDPEEAARAIWEHQGKQVASNGAVMRTSIVGVHNFWNTDEVVKNAIEITKTTHYDPRCQASSVAVSVAIATMLQGNHRDKKGHFKVKDVINEAYEHASKCLETDEEKKDLLFYLECEKIKELNLDESKKIGYTYKTMGAGFWALKQSNFRKAITKVMLQGGDADTNACVGGGLLGCKLGMSALPESWVTKLLHKEWLDNEFKRYFKLMKWEWNDKPKGK